MRKEEEQGGSREVHQCCLDVQSVMLTAAVQKLVDSCLYFLLVKETLGTIWRQTGRSPSKEGASWVFVAIALPDGPADVRMYRLREEKREREHTETTPQGSVQESPGLDALSMHLYAFMSPFPPLILLWQQKVNSYQFVYLCSSQHSHEPQVETSQISTDGWMDKQNMVYPYNGYWCCCSVADSWPTLWPHGLQHTRLPCPPKSLGVCSNLCPLSWWCYLTILPSAALFFCLQSFPASGSFPMSRLFTSGGHSTGVSASVLFFPMNIQAWFPQGLTCLVTWLSKGLSRVFSTTVIRKHQFFGAQPSFWSNSHIYTWLLEKP